MSTSLRFLHLSDLHFSPGDMTGSDWAAQRLMQDVVNNSLLDALTIELENKPLDFVIITGDIANRGKREEYAVAAQFFKRLAEITGLELKRFFLVPGNHDVDRAKVPSTHRRFYRFDSQEEIAEIFADPDLRPLILRKFNEFNDFSEQMMGRRHYDETTYHLTEVLALEKNNQILRINLLGLNSALFCGYDGDEEQGLALGLNQVDKALEQMDETAPLSLGFFHHPFSVLHPADEVCSNRLKHKLDMVLHGHIHDAKSVEENSGAGQAIILSAGAAYQGRDQRNGFNLIAIDLYSGKGQIEFFKYLPEHHCWNRDTDVCPHAPQGKFNFQARKLEKFISPPEPEQGKESFTDTPVQPETNHQSSNQVIDSSSPETIPRSKLEVYQIHDYLLPDNFTGRIQQRQQLKEFLHGEGQQPASLIAICALGGMGKSCLARQVLEGLSTQALDARPGETIPYQQAVWFSFSESRTEDEAYAFKEILSFLTQKTEFSNELAGSALAKKLSKELGNYLDKNPVLLILDGLEVIQHTDDVHSPHYGQIRAEHKEIKSLLKHCCNQNQNKNKSRVLITTRVPLTDLEGAARYSQLSLPVFSTLEAADYLEKFNIQGNQEQLQHCAELFGGHPLCLKAAGKQMQRRHIAAAEVEKLIGDTELFRRNSEGERVAKIVNTYRQDLSPEQEHFLKMLSIHPRSVTERHFLALVQDYGNNGRDKHWVADKIIFPLETLGLIEVLHAPDNDYQYSSHPLMKLAYAAWLGGQDKSKAHESWAKAAQTSPALAGSPAQANSLEALQPWLDVVEHYLAAEDWDAAWQIYRDRNVDDRLMDLAYLNHLLVLGLRFKQALLQGWDLNATQQHLLYEYLGHACNGLECWQENLDYREKAFAATQEAGDVDKIVLYAAQLAESYIHLGDLQKAAVVLEKIKSQAEALSAGQSKRIYQGVQAKKALFSGEYQQAVPLYKGRIKAETNAYSRSFSCLFLGETQLRANLYQAAEVSLQLALEGAEKKYITKLIPAILERLTWLDLKQQQFSKARAYNNRRVDLEKSLDLPGQEDDGFLLLGEGKFQTAATQAQTWLDRPEEERLEKRREIEYLIILSQGQHGLGNLQQAKKRLQQAKDLMQKTGCWLDKNRLEETEALLAG